MGNKVDTEWWVQKRGAGQFFQPWGSFILLRSIGSGTRKISSVGCFVFSAPILPTAEILRVRRKKYCSLLLFVPIFQDSVGQLDQNEFFDELNKRPTWETPHNQVDGNGSQEPDEAGSSSFSTSEVGLLFSVVFSNFYFLDR